MVNSKRLPKFFTSLMALSTLLLSCNVKENKNESQMQVIPLEGTWELISETKIEKEDTTYSPASSSQRMIKIINQTHFAFLRHDLNQGKDSTTLFVAGGGRYFLKDQKYEEHLEYCNFREWENNTFQFTIAIQNDTLTQRGTEKIEGLGIDRIIIEKYKRVRE